MVGSREVLLLIRENRVCVENGLIEKRYESDGGKCTMGTGEGREKYVKE